MEDNVTQNIARCFSDETRAANRYEAFAMQAEKEGRLHAALLFRAVANAKSVHGRRFRLLMRGKIGATEDNLRSALESEKRAREIILPAMKAEAAHSPKAVKKAFAQSTLTDGEYADLFGRALEKGEDTKSPVFFVCQICGHIHQDAVPDNCPVCQAVPGRFKRVD